MASTLGDELRVDYSDLRGEAPFVTTRAEYVASRKAAHGHLKTHHLLSNLDIRFDSGRAEVNASCVIFRTDGEQSFNSHALYHFRLKRAGDEWRIVAIRQAILWNEGNPAIHEGVTRNS